MRFTIHDLVKPVTTRNEHVYRASDAWPRRCRSANVSYVEDRLAEVGSSTAEPRAVGGRKGASRARRVARERGWCARLPDLSATWAAFRSIRGYTIGVIVCSDAEPRSTPQEPQQRGYHDRNHDARNAREVEIESVADDMNVARQL
jgi:hypothetical protein